jgi:hypothetical protein
MLFLSVFTKYSLALVAVKATKFFATVTTPLLIYHFERRIPKLVFEKRYRKYRESQTNNVVFFIRIRNVNKHREGRAEFCSGLIEVMGTSIKNMPTIWVENSQEDFSFADYADLRLFTAKEGEEINFYNKQQTTNNVRPALRVLPHA